MDYKEIIDFFSYMLGDEEDLKDIIKVIKQEG